MNTLGFLDDLHVQYKIREIRSMEGSKNREQGHVGRSGHEKGEETEVMPLGKTID